MSELLTITLAQGGGQGEDFGKSSPVGLVILVLFFIAVALLVRSMTKHLRRVPPKFGADDQSGEESTDSPGDETADAQDGDSEDGARKSSDS